MAPEMVTGKEKQGTAMDWWALGVMLYEMTLGRLPFNNHRMENDDAVFRSIVNADVSFPRNHRLSSSAVDLILELLRKVGDLGHTIFRNIGHCTERRDVRGNIPPESLLDVDAPRGLVIDFMVS